MKPRLHVLSVMALVGAGATSVACRRAGDDTPNGAPIDAGSGSFDAGGGIADAKASPISEAGLDAAAPADATPAIDATPDAAPLASIDPLAVGNAWTYDVTQLGFYPACPSGSHVGSVASAAQRDGRLAYEVISLCDGLGPYYYSEAGDVVSWDDLGVWELVLDAPVVEGHTWTSGLTTWVWHDLGTVAVTAGSFDRCFKAQDTNGPSYTVFCRGVGPIHWHYDDGSGNGYDAILASKNF